MLKDLIQEIEKIGKKKLDEIEKAHKENIKRLEKEYAEKRTLAVEKIEKRAEEAGRQVVTRTEMLANTERRKQILAKKREVIDQIFVDSLELLASSPNYKKYLGLMIEQASKEVSEGEVIYAKSKKDATEDAIKGTGYKLAKEGKFHGGFIIINGKVEYDFTFDSIVGKQLRDELETKVAHILF
ncbi:MAG: hypothetical protein ACD_65C00123G0003 [uncultured bacterium]|nr:MAG: hypothetical protein ACD_65C00123G0003 [uncultured bacterium]